MSSSPAIFWRRFCLGGPDTSQSTAISDSSAGSTKTGPSKVGDVVTLPGLWTNFGPLSRGWRL